MIEALAANNKKNESLAEDEMVKLLKSIDTKLDSLHDKTDKIEQQAMMKGALAGGVSGGIVAAGIAIIKSKFGL